MADTTFVDGVTVSAASWFNDLNDGYYAGWTTPEFSAGNFTASGSMTWTVASGDVRTYAYRIFYKTMTILFDIAGTTVGGTLDTSLRIAIPASKVATKDAYNTCVIYDNSATVIQIGRVAIAATGTYLQVLKVPTANFTASTDLTYVNGQITFEIN